MEAPQEKKPKRRDRQRNESGYCSFSDSTMSPSPQNSRFPGSPYSPSLFSPGRAYSPMAMHEGSDSSDGEYSEQEESPFDMFEKVYLGEIQDNKSNILVSAPPKYDDIQNIRHEETNKIEASIPIDTDEAVDVTRELPSTEELPVDLFFDYEGVEWQVQASPIRHEEMEMILNEFAYDPVEPKDMDQYIETSSTADLDLIQEIIDFDIDQKVNWDGHLIPVKILSEAFRTEKPVFAAQVLFKHLFSDEEINVCSLSGKCGSEMMDRVKMLAIIRLVGFMQSLWNQGLSTFVFSSMDCLGKIDTPLSSNVVKDNIERSVFTYYRNQCSRKRKRQISPATGRTDNQAIKVEQDLDGNEKRIETVPVNKYNPIEWSSGHFICKKIWAAAFYESDFVKTAGVLFEAFFTEDEIKNCTLNGKKGTDVLSLEKRTLIFNIVQWMKDKGKYPYAFPMDLFLRNNTDLPLEEQTTIGIKIFTQRRNQLSRLYKKRETQ